MRKIFGANQTKTVSMSSIISESLPKILIIVKKSWGKLKY